MPPNTPTVYVVGALIALGGVLFGALGQIVSSTLQRRHERRLKLDEIRRETYAEFLYLIGESEQAHAALQLAEKTQVQGLASSAQRLKEARARVRELWTQLAPLVARVELLSGERVQRASNAIAEQLFEGITREVRDELVNAFREELGASGPVVPYQAPDS